MSAVHNDRGYRWTVRRMAETASLSPSRLTARFPRALGVSPMSYVTRWRMMVASQMLIETSLQIQEVAERVGYASQPSFSRAFRSLYQQAPRDYRTNQRAIAARQDHGC